MEDIEIANKFNPNFIGFVFTESKRKISFEYAEKLKKRFNNDILAVGIFLDSNVDDIIYLIEKILLILFKFMETKIKKLSMK